jgi:organic hydroperoxide reductase OsmC/OhrA
VNHVTVVDYRDHASGVMEEHDDGSGEFVSVTLKPSIRILPGDDREKALALHAEAHHMCFIARSVDFPVEIAAEITGTSGPE